MASDTYHEPLELLSEPTRDMHRAITSLMEELEAVDWYNQRAEATQDAELRAVIEHNRDEEIEHAMMVLEWLRRTNPMFDKNIHTYLMKQGPILAIEEATTGDAESAPPEATSPRASVSTSRSEQGRSSDGSLGVGSLKGT